MLTPRHAIRAGLVLVVLAVVLASHGHAFWILFALFWFAGPRSCGGVGRRSRYYDVRRDDVRPDDSLPEEPPVPVPDPDHDRHEAFPGSR